MQAFSLHSLCRPLALAALVTASAAAQAAPITYIFTGLAGGTFTPSQGAPQEFSRLALTVTISTDTTNIDGTRFGASIPATNTLVSGLISVAGLGSGSFVNPLYVFTNQGTEIVGFGDLSNNDLIDIPNTVAGLDTYDMKSDFGPIGGTSAAFVSQFVNIPLSFGTMTLSALFEGTFQAITDPGPTVPEPQTIALLAAALALMAATRARRSAR